MALTVFSRITGTGSALPVKSVTNDELARELALKGIETNDEWIRTRTGICARRIASGTETTTTLAVAAAKNALTAACRLLWVAAARLLLTCRRSVPVLCMHLEPLTV